jgi:multiple sugar transport system ATP-binding protein
MRLELPRLLARQGATVIYVTQDYKEAMALGDRIAVMAEGKVQQLGTPEEIYLRPANMEIARLFGDPTINLLDVTPKEDGIGIYVELSNVKVHLAGAPSSVVGQACVLGLRPESIHFTDVTQSGAVPVHVEAETPLNEKTVTLVLTARRREILVSRPAGSPGPKAGAAAIAIDAASALLFDKASGQRISANGQDMTRGEAA